MKLKEKRLKERDKKRKIQGKKKIIEENQNPGFNKTRRLNKAQYDKEIWKS